MGFLGNHAQFWMGDGAISSLNHKAFDALVSKLSASAIPIGPPSTINTGISFTLAKRRLPAVEPRPGRLGVILVHRNSSQDGESMPGIIY